MMAVYCEVKPKLSVAHVILDTEFCGTEMSDLKLTIQKNTIEVYDSTSADERHTLGIEAVGFLPMSCHSLQRVGRQELHLRLQVVIDRQQDGIKQHLERQTDSTSSHAKWTNAQASSDVGNITCRMCCSVLVRSQQLQRVLPLPMNSWHEVSESWFCHKEEADALQRPSCLSPRRGDCLVGDTFVLLPWSSLQDEGFVKGSRGCLQCCRCRQKLGCSLGGAADDSKPFSAKLFTDQLWATGHGTPHRSLSSMESDTAQLLLTLSDKYSAFRFLLESQDTTGCIQPYIMLSLMDKDTLLARATLGKEQSLPLVPVVRFLYKDCITDAGKSVESQWSTDMAVHNVQLSRETCLQVLHQLVVSTRTMPRSLRVAGGFYVGYLKR